MLLLITLWLILIAVCVLTGMRILHALDAREFDRTGDRFVVSVWLGIAVLSATLLAASLVFPLSPAVGAAVACVLLLVSLLHRGTRHEAKAFCKLLSPRLILGVLALMAGVAFYETQIVTWYDTGLYHYGVVKWLSKFGAVMGVALLHIRFGLASSWFALNAPFDAGVLEARTVTLLGGLALLLAAFHLVLCASRCLTNRARAADWFVVFASLLFIPIVVYANMFVSPSPDVPVIILPVLTAWTLLVILNAPQGEQKRSRIFSTSLIPFILAASAMTMKLSALMLVLIAALFYLHRSGTGLRSVLTLGVVGLALVAPFVCYQLVTSGCPLLPTTFMCRGAAWATKPIESKSLTDQIVLWGRWNGPPPADANAFNWLWRGWITAGTTPKILLSIAASTLIAASGFIIRRAGGQVKIGRWLMTLGIAALAFVLMFRAPNLLTVYVLLLAAVAIYGREFAGKRWLMATGLLGVAMMMYSAPYQRVGLGYVAVLFGAFVVTHQDALQRAARPAALAAHVQRQPLMMLALLSVAGGLTIGLCRVALTNHVPRSTPVVETQRESFPLLMPPRLPAAVVSRERADGIDYYKPVTGDQCWATELPCLPAPLLPDVAPRDPTLGIGAGVKR